MYLSNRDIRWAIDQGRLIVSPRPEDLGTGYDETAIDLHLDTVQEARIWDIAKFTADQRVHGASGPELHLGAFDARAFSEKYLVNPPEESDDATIRAGQLVCKRARQVIVKPGGFLLWTTKERVGTPTTNPTFIAFVNAKSTRARTGIIVHFTAPTIHASWQGKIILDELPTVLTRMRQRLEREAAPREAANLWSATYILMGLRYEQAVIQQLMKGVLGMKESVTYQAILEEGEAKGEAKGRAEGQATEARRLLLLLGRDQFGEPPAKVKAAIDALDVARLEELALQVKRAASWQELLGFQPIRRRSTGRKPSA